MQKLLSSQNKEINTAIVKYRIVPKKTNDIYRVCGIIAYIIIFDKIVLGYSFVKRQNITRQ